mmetsp:Transcript_3380/g.7959  ORF Transcript_3380/g.7959 Transcript_3380/m.7959 type:complete len:207 (+) Transcript_3380:43-663(+)
MDMGKHEQASLLCGQLPLLFLNSFCRVIFFFLSVLALPFAILSFTIFGLALLALAVLALAVLTLTFLDILAVLPFSFAFVFSFFFTCVLALAFPLCRCTCWLTCCRLQVLRLRPSSLIHRHSDSNLVTHFETIQLCLVHEEVAAKLLRDSGTFNETVTFVVVERLYSSQLTKCSAAFFAGALALDLDGHIRHHRRLGIKKRPWRVS